MNRKRNVYALQAMSVLGLLHGASNVLGLYPTSQQGKSFPCTEGARSTVKRFSTPSPWMCDTAWAQPNMAS
ncbi:MAG: hypothetical protein JRM79_00255 [Nitrososphaerota archaeon]|nr:hypothetical protein [Nitrososphaerota archaeon]MDG6903747.1 hypothetical protein [Nitrososphaerota archaeon]MDG6912157.1 hypothetical protein [Nitrososphaerota archaeon]MDG6924594.1 hypothetical protein [Nitrososphaerota archaeon]MDG6941157.1 hypothetical protein [Nitrososphaerota archaeon]